MTEKRKKVRANEEGKGREETEYGRGRNKEINRK